jgi:hypothetical protein
MGRLDVLITCRISEEDLAVLTLTAQNQGRSRSALVRELLKEALDAATDQIASELDGDGQANKTVEVQSETQQQK